MFRLQSGVLPRAAGVRAVRARVHRARPRRDQLRASLAALVVLATLTGSLALFVGLGVDERTRHVSEVRSPVSQLLLVLGGLLGLALAVHFARKAGRLTRKLARTREQMELQVLERTAELRRSNQSLIEEAAERARAEQALRDLPGRLLRRHDEERRHFGRELHDSTARTLGALAIGLDLTRRSLKERGSRELGAALEESVTLLEQATHEIRALSSWLHPPMLDGLGLEYALPWYSHGFSSRSGIAVFLDLPGGLGRLPSEVEWALFRVVEEGLSNVHRHSGSRTACITLLRREGSVTLEISDQGCGFGQELDRGGGSLVELGVGLAGIRERVRQLGGEFDIRGAEGGTTVKVVLPLARAESAARSERGNSVSTAA